MNWVKLKPETVARIIECLEYFIEEELFWRDNAKEEIEFTERIIKFFRPEGIE